MKLLYKYPQREFPYDDLVADQRPPRPRRVRVRADRHRHLRRGPLLRRLRRVRQGRAGRHPHRGTVHNRGPDAATLHLLPTLWFRNTWAWTARRAGAVADAGRDGRRAPHGRQRLPPRAGRMAAAVRGPGRAPVLRERDEQPATVRRAECRRVRQGRHQRLRRLRRRGRRQPGATGNQGRGAAPARARARARARVSACA